MDNPVESNIGEIVFVNIDELRPNPRNPNTHPPEQLALLCKTIAAQGWRLPICVSTRSGYIVRGHGRYEAAKLLGCTTVPVSYQAYESDDLEMADLLMDNRINELNEWNNASLKDLLESMDTGALDMNLTGFTDDELNRLMSQFHTEEEPVSTDEDAPSPKICRPYEKWQLGLHALTVGMACADECDALIVAWQSITGMNAQLVSTGETYNNLTRIRTGGK